MRIGYGTLSLYVFSKERLFMPLEPSFRAERGISAGARAEIPRLAVLARDDGFEEPGT